MPCVQKPCMAESKILKSTGHKIEKIKASEFIVMTTNTVNLY